MFFPFLLLFCKVSKMTAKQITKWGRCKHLGKRRENWRETYAPLCLRFDVLFFFSREKQRSIGRIIFPHENFFYVHSSERRFSVSHI